MNLFEVFTKEKDYDFHAKVAECASKHSAINNLSSSGFIHALTDLVNDELSQRCDIYLNHYKGNKLEDFNEFFQKLENGLLSNIQARFGKVLYGQDRRNLIKEKYFLILSEASTSKQHKEMGFHT